MWINFKIESVYACFYEYNLRSSRYEFLFSWWGQQCFHNLWEKQCERDKSTQGLDRSHNNRYAGVVRWTELYSEIPSKKGLICLNITILWLCVFTISHCFIWMNVDYTHTNKSGFLRRSKHIMILIWTLKFRLLV